MLKYFVFFLICYCLFFVCPFWDALSWVISIVQNLWQLDMQFQQFDQISDISQTDWKFDKCFFHCLPCFACLLQGKSNPTSWSRASTITWVFANDIESSGCCLIAKGMTTLIMMIGWGLRWSMPKMMYSFPNNSVQMFVCVCVLGLVKWATSIYCISMCKL